MISLSDSTKTGPVRTYVVQTDPDVFSGFLPDIPANRRQPERIITEYEVLSNCYQIGSLEPSNPLV